MDAIIDAVYVPTHMPPSVLVIRLILAGVFGAVLGVEREAKARPAGLRTYTLTAIAACVFTVLMVEILKSPLLTVEHVTVDPVRIIEAVTSGVAFLAAGAIIQSRGQVKGLTTGAGMWLAGAIGVACGLGYLFVALVATVVCLLTALAGNWLGKAEKPADG